MSLVFNCCESRVLTNPLTNTGGKWICCKYSYAPRLEVVWLCQNFHFDIPLTLLVFDDEKEFERFYKNYKQKYTNEQIKKHNPCSDVQHIPGQEIPF